MLHTDCEKGVQKALHSVNTIRYVARAIETLTEEPFDFRMIKCVDSKNAHKEFPRTSMVHLPFAENTASHAVEGGYLWKNTPNGAKGQIILHQNTVRGGENELHRLLLHEMIHAYDDARAEVDPSNCLHHACSEVRASRLSGECLWNAEWGRGHHSPIGAGMRCVQRRATLSVSQNPNCRGVAERAVEKVFPQCYKDYEPFSSPLYTSEAYPEDEPKRIALNN